MELKPLNQASPSCPACGRALPATAPGGLCSACLLSRALLSAAEEDLHEEAQQIGDYELLAPIARGGMGIVYRARQKSLNRIVALKLILAGDLAPPELIERFRVEAEAAASLDHPNIVSVYEVGEADGRHFLTMKLVEGGNLAERLARGQKFSVQEAARTVAKLAHAVQFAHQRGVLHRDIKPTNVLIDTHAEPVLTDFGLAKLIEHETQITHTLAVLGTPSYISPEQAAGQVRHVTTAVDVYGLGALLYELLAGAPPFAGGTTLATIRMVLEQDPQQPSRRNPQVDRDLDTICLKCLAKEPGARYHSAEAVAEDLERWLRREPILARPAGAAERLAKWVRRHPARALSLAVIGLALVSVTVVSDYSRRRVSAALAVSQKQKGEIEQQQIAIARHAAETAGQLAYSLELQAAQHAAAGRHSSALGYWAQVLRLNPSNHVAASRIFQTLIRGGFVQPLGPALNNGPYAHASSFSPDGSHLVIASERGKSQLFIRAAADGKLLRAIDAGGSVAAFDFSPDGTKIATLVGLAGWGNGRVRLWSTANGQPLVPEFLLPDSGYRINFNADGTLLSVPWAIEPQILAASATRLGLRTNARPAEKPYFVVDMVWGAGPGQLFILGDDKQVRWLDAFSGTTLARRNLNFAELAAQLIISPDHHVLAARDKEGGEVALLDAADLRILQELHHPQPVTGMAFSPDSSLLAVTGNDATLHLWSVEGTRHKLLPTGAPQAGPTFSADGTKLAAVGLDHTARLWSIPQGEPLCEPLQLGQRVLSVCLNPTGDRLLTTCADGSATLWEANPAHAAELRFTAARPILSTHLSRDGTQAFLTTDAGLETWDLETSKHLTTLSARPEFPIDPQFSPDDRYVLLPMAKATVFDCASGISAGPPLALPAPATATALSPDGRLLASGDEQGRVRLWNWRTGELLASPVVLDPQEIMRLGFSPDSRRLFATARNLHLYCWDSATGSATYPPLKMDNFGATFDFLGDGHRFAAHVGFDVHLYETATGRAEPLVLHHDLPNMLVRTSPDGERLALVAEDNRVSEYSTHGPAPLISPLPHAARVSALEYDAAGRRFATGTATGDLEVFDAASGRSLTGVLHHGRAGQPGAIVSLHFTTDDRRLLSASADGLVCLWDLGPTAAEPIPGWLPELAEAIAGLKVGGGGSAEAPIGLEPVAHEKRRAIRLQLSEVPGQTAWAQLPRWLFADPQIRARSPFYESRHP